MSERIDRAMESALKKAGVWGQTMRYRCLSLWKEAAGERIASHARPVKIVGNEMIIHVTSPSWRQELHLLTPRLLENLNRLAGDKYVTGIRFTSSYGVIEEGDTDSQQKLRALRRWVGITKFRGLLIAPAEAQAVRAITRGLPDDIARTARRFFVTLVRRRRLLEEKGWQKCSVCGALAESGLCPACKTELREKRLKRAIDSLRDRPWLSTGGFTALDAEFTQGDYVVASDHLVGEWSRELQVLQRRRTKAALAEMKVVACNLAMLIAHTPPDLLDDTTFSRALRPGILRKLGIIKDETEG